jgi:hypothetical protein
MYSLTEKGQNIAQKLKEIESILREGLQWAESLGSLLDIRFCHCKPKQKHIMNGG